MKLVQVVRRMVPDAWGGIETLVSAVVRELDARGHRSVLLATSALSRPGDDQVYGIPLTRYRYAYLRVPPRRALRDALDRKGGNPIAPGLLHRLVTEPDVDLFVTHTAGRLAAAVRLAARIRRVPYVVFVHGGHADVPPAERRALARLYEGSVDPLRPLDRWLGTGRVIRDAAAVVAYGRGEYEGLRAERGAARTWLLPNGVDVERFAGVGPAAAQRARAVLGVPPGAKLLLCVARIDPQKGQETLVDALARLVERERDVHVALVGHPTSPDYLAGLRRGAVALGLGDRLHVVEGLPFDAPLLPALYRAADVFVLPTRHEPFGIVVLEAWAAGRPVVASRVGGIPSFATDGETALLTPPGDAEALARAIHRVLAEPALARRLARAGHRLARSRYSWARVTDQVLTVFEAARGRSPALALADPAPSRPVARRRSTSPPV